MKLYRYMNSQYANIALSGTFRFGRLIEYQLMEYVTGDIKRGDSHEGLAKTIVSAEITKTNKNPKIEELCARLGIKVGDEGKVVLNGVNFIEQIDCFIYCLSQNEPENQPDIGEDCDTCLTIHDADEFFSTLWNSGVEENSNKPIKQIYSGLQYDEVSYTWSEGDFYNSGLASPSPFIKRDIYKNQAEFRAALFPLAESKFGFINIKCPQATKFLSSKKLPNSKQIVNTESHREHLFSLEECESLLEKIWQLSQAESRQVMDVTYSEPFISPEEDASNYKKWADSFDQRYRQIIIQTIYNRRKFKPNARLDGTIIRGASAERLLQVWRQSNMLTR